MAKLFSGRYRAQRIGTADSLMFLVRTNQCGAALLQPRRPVWIAGIQRRVCRLARETTQFATIWWLLMSTVTRSKRDWVRLFTPTW